MSRFAMLFPGQGSQSVGMLAALAEAHPEVAETFAEAEAALGYDLAGLVRDGPQAELDRTEYTQPALLAAGVAVWRAWRAAGGGEPAALAGHSLGEYAALVAADALDFGDALRLTRLRGQAMQAAVAAGDGAMAAVIGLDDDAVAAVCAAAAQGQVVQPANLNAPGQVVIAGHTAAVERAAARAKEQGAKLVKTLAVSVPSHCALMGPAAERLQAHLQEVPLRQPRIRVLHNVDAQARDDVEAIRKALVAQLERPVRWRAIVQALAADGCTTMLECGPGKVLTGLNRRIDKTIESFALQDPDGLRAALRATEDLRAGRRATEERSADLRGTEDQRAALRATE